MKLKRIFLILSFALAGSLAVQADVKLPALFCDHAVLQQGQAIKIWGWAEPGEPVTVEFRQQKVSVKTPAEGRWLVELKSEKAGGPDVLKVTGKNSLVLNDVLVGEVWVASGQSNMEWPLHRSFEVAADIAAAANPHIRHFNVQKAKADQPAKDVIGTWQVAGPLTVSNCSAVAYYFSRELQAAIKVPVGIIHTSWGGSPAEVWMSEAALSRNPDYKRDILDPSAASKERADKALEQYRKEKTQAQQEKKPFTKQPPRAPWKPTELYNGMLAPLMPYTIQGAIWYQGEANAGRAAQYRTLYPDMIRNWRQDWGQGDFTFLGVQLAAFDHSRKRTWEEITAMPTNSSWAELREAQTLATKVLKNCGIAIATDVGEKDDIHPTKKQPVGARLALQAREIAYGEKIVSAGPTFKSVQWQDGKATLSFDHVGGGLVAQGGELKRFAVAGEDQKFVWAMAEIQGDKIVVSCPSIAKPVAVRFAWADYPVVNLFNKEGLPAAPFRTDDFPLTTAPKK